MKKWEVVKLKFEVFWNVNDIHNSLICPPIYSRRIVYQSIKISIVLFLWLQIGFNKTFIDSSGEELRIVKMVKNEGLWTGNEEVCVLIKGLKEISVGKLVKPTNAKLWLILRNVRINISSFLISLLSEDVGILFFIKTGDYMPWSVDARFSPTDLHEKSAIVFKWVFLFSFYKVTRICQFTTKLNSQGHRAILWRWQNG